MFRRMRALLEAAKERRTQARLAREATVWLTDDTLNTALAQMRQAAETAWLAADNPAVREACWAEVHRINQFVRALARLVANEKIALENDKRADRSARSA